MGPEAAKEEVDIILQAGGSAQLVQVNGQLYVGTQITGVPMPPWNQNKQDILVAIPAASGAALDAFYIALPYTFNGKEHPRAQGNIIKVGDREYKLVSWHYTEEKPWKDHEDSLASHLAHCMGFFMHRGAKNEM